MATNNQGVEPVNQDYWVHGHFIGSCTSPEEALIEASRLYDEKFEDVRAWTPEDQAELDWQTQEG